jgi:hypothetical protein
MTIVEPTPTELANRIGPPPSESPLEMVCRLHGKPLYSLAARDAARREAEVLRSSAAGLAVA